MTARFSSLQSLYSLHWRRISKAGTTAASLGSAAISSLTFSEVRTSWRWVDSQKSTSTYMTWVVPTWDRARLRIRFTGYSVAAYPAVATVPTASWSRAHPSRTIRSSTSRGDRSVYTTAEMGAPVPHLRQCWPIIQSLSSDSCVTSV